MKILLWSDDLLSRMRIESAWKAAGAQVLKKTSTERPDYIVVDLTARGALEHIARLRAEHPDLDILAFGPHVDADALRAAKAAGASELSSRGGVLERVKQRILTNAEGEGQQ